MKSMFEDVVKYTDGTKKEYLNWEFVDNRGAMQRLKIFGGWVITIEQTVDISDSIPNIVHRDYALFIPDPKHEWKIEDFKKYGVYHLKD